MRSKPQTYERRLDVRALMVVADLFGRGYQQRQLVGRCEIPATGPAIIAANHTSGLDPLAIQSTCPRPITWVMTSEFYDLPSLKWFLEHVEMIRIDREAHDTKAWRQALRVLGDGRVVGVFPEGRIETERSLMPFGVGVATMALRGKADIHPVFIDGRQRRTPMLEAYLTPQTPMIAWGKPISVTAGNKRRRPQELTDELAASIRSLQETHTARRMKGRSLLGNAT